MALEERFAEKLREWTRVFAFEFLKQTVPMRIVRERIEFAQRLLEQLRVVAHPFVPMARTNL
jgi:hypothetical protein